MKYTIACILCIYTPYIIAGNSLSGKMPDIRLEAHLYDAHDGKEVAADWETYHPDVEHFYSRVTPDIKPDSIGTANIMIMTRETCIYPKERYANVYVTVLVNSVNDIRSAPIKFGKDSEKIFFHNRKLYAIISAIKVHLEKEHDNQ